MSVRLSGIVAFLCERVGLSIDEYDVSDLTDVEIDGHQLNRAGVTAGGGIDALRAIGAFDIVESEAKLKFRRRGGESVATLTREDMGARLVTREDEPAVGGAAISTRKLQDIELPRQMRVQYRSLSRDYERGEQLSPVRIGTVGVNDVTMQLSTVMTDALAAKVAEIGFREAWASRWSHTFAVGPKWHALEPGDPLKIPLNDRLYRVRIVSIDDAGLLVRKIEALRDDDGAYTSTAIVTPTAKPPTTITLIGGTDIELLDLPALNEAHDDAGFYAAVWRIGIGQTWTGAKLHKSLDGGTTFSEVASFAAQATVGTLVSAPASGSTSTWDEDGEIVVDIENDGTLESRTDDAVLAGANALAIGAHGRRHIVQFGTAELVSAGRYRLTHLLLGRRGTEHLVGTEQVGDSVVLVSGSGIYRVPLQTSEIGAQRAYRIVSNGAAFSTGQTIDFTGDAQALECFSPVNVTGTRDGSENLTIDWDRRDRLSKTLMPSVELPLSEASEAYEVDVLFAGSVLRTLAGLSSPQAVYSAADQTTDFGTTVSSVTVRIYQLSAVVGRGMYVEATV